MNMFLLFTGDPASRTTEVVDNVMIYIVAISVLLLIGVTVTMVYFVFKYHRNKGHKPVDIHGNVWLEILWIGIPTILIMTMFYYGYMGFRVIRDIPDNVFEVNATARMWNWQFNYDNGKITDTLYIPLDPPTLLHLSSVDVNHSFYVPAFRVKEDVIAGRENYLILQPAKTGDYDVACAEYCGLNHSMMYTKVKVLTPEKFNLWYSDTSSVSAAKATKAGL